MENKNWHVQNWHLLGWIETVVKTGAIIIGIYAFLQAIKSDIFLSWSELPKIQLIILILLSLGILLAIYDRYQKKDIVSMIFVLFNNWGHWGLVYAIFKGVNLIYLFYFALFMLIGDLVKIVFLKKYNYSERDLAPKKFIYLTSIYIIGYLLIITFNFSSII